MKLELQDPSGTPPAAPTSPLRIAFLSYRSDPKVGGQGIFVTQVAAALARRHHRVDILSGPPYPVVPAGVRLVPIPSLDLYAQPHLGRRALRPRHFRRWTDLAEFFGHHGGRFMEPWSFGRRAARRLRAHGGAYDVVLDNQSLSDGLLAIQAGGLPVVAIVHHPVQRDLALALDAEPSRSRRWLIRRWYGFLAMQERVAPRLSRIVTVSTSSARDAERLLGIDPAAISVVPPGVDGAVFRPRPEIVREPALIVSTASADVPLKGLRYLLEAFAALATTRPQLRLTLVGKLRTGATADLLVTIDLGDRVRFVSDLSGDEMGRLFASATLCVSPSLYEGFGLPAAEAMACGTPVVVTDGGALPEVVGDAGIVVPKADAAALAAGIATLLDDPAERARLGARGLARARAEYSWDRLALRYEAVLRGAIASC